jgi:hypothetical protein
MRLHGGQCCVLGARLLVVRCARLLLLLSAVPSGAAQEKENPQQRNKEERELHKNLMIT